MKRLLLFLLTAHFSLLTLFSQAPQGFNYQAVARDTDGSLLASETIDVKIGIRSGNETGPLVWEETHSVTTNEFGLFTLKIGDVTATPGSGSAATFSDVDWSTGAHYLGVEIDLGSGFVTMGTSELLSVPFALFAEAGNEGPQGAQGPQGIQGPQGDTGPNGAQGDQGPIGPTGDTGPQGLKGDKGDLGDTGDTGLTGPQGPKGDAGTGLINRGAWSSDSTYNDGNYTFDRSTDDPLINSMWIFQGTGPYTSGTQPYQDTGNWVEFEAPPGPEGPQGPIGLDGPKGDTGDTGLQGPVGATGATGAQGPQGDTGPQGAQGEQGPQGDQGPKGDQGLQNDPAEDVNSDGFWNALDCKGPQGDEASDDQDLVLSGNTLSLTNDPTTVDLSGYLDDTDNQGLNLSGDILTIQGGSGLVDLSLYVDDADANPANELNSSLVLNGSILELTDAGGTLTANLTSLADADADPTNELNTGAILSGTTLQITDAGGTIPVDLVSLGDDADADPTNELISTAVLNATDLEITDAGGTKTINLGSLVNDADFDPANEFQSLTLSTNILGLTNDGITVDLSPYLDDSNLWSLTGNTVFYNDGNVGIGTETPGSRLEVMGNLSGVPEDPLFEVRRKDGQKELREDLPLVDSLLLPKELPRNT